MNDIKLKNHRCKRLTCNRISRNGDNRVIYCLVCNEIYYTQCFDLKLDSVKHKSFFQPNSHVQFICASCYEPLVKLIAQSSQQQQQQQAHADKTRSTDNSQDKNHSSKTSNSNSTLASSQSANGTNCGNSNNISTNNNIAIDLLKSFENKLLQMELTMQEFNKVQKSQAEASLKHEEAVCNEISKINENCNKLLVDSAKTTHSLSKVATVDQLKSSTSNICSSIEKTVKSKPTPGNSNALDWSVLNDSLSADDATNGRPSILIRQSIDDSIVDMLKNSDSTTWKSLDLLFEKLQEQSDRVNDNVNSIGDDIRLLTTKIENSLKNNMTVRSPLMDSIFHDTLSDNINKILSEITNLNKNSQQQNLIAMSNDVRVQNSTEIDSNVDRLAGHSQHNVDISTRSSTDLLNSTEVFPMSQLANEMNAFTSNNITDDSTVLNISAGRRQYSQGVHSANGTPRTEAATVNNNSIAVHEAASNSTVSRSHVDMTGSQSTSTEDLSFMNFQPLNNLNNLINSSEEQCTNCSCNIELHLSNATPNTTVDEIVNYININCDTNTRASRAFRVYKLLKKNQDTTNLKFVNFKVECCSHLSHIITRNNFWPTHCKIKPFVRRNVGQFSQPSNGNFRIDNQQHIETRST